MDEVKRLWASRGEQVHHILEQVRVLFDNISVRVSSLGFRLTKVLGFRVQLPLGVCFKAYFKPALLRDS